MEKYNFIVYQNETGLIQQITNTSASNLPRIPKEDGVTAIHVDFFNDITDCYYNPKNGKFYVDEAKTEEIVNPATYERPVIEIESEPRYTLDEACEIIAEEVSGNVG